ncbi:MAG: glycogen synthase [Chlamydiota bacterium]
MKIVHITSELTPIAKVGGLADFVQGLSAALVEKKESAVIFLPFYKQIDKKKLYNLRQTFSQLAVLENNTSHLNTVWSAEVDGLRVLLLEPHHPKRYFERSAIYGEKDDVARFSYFSRAVLEYLLQADYHPDIIHLHDWITGLCAPLYREIYRSLGLHVGGLVTTLHNLCYQGVCIPESLTQIGLPADYLMTHDKLQHPTRPNRANILKGAVVYSDRLTTVSPSYCEEIKQTRGSGLSPLLIKHEDKLTGILNGLDTDYWDPTRDPHLQERYPQQPPSISAILAAKKANRIALAKKTGLKVSENPLVACVTRLAKQKGPELIRAGLEAAIQANSQAILLGSIAEKELELPFHALQERYQSSGAAYFFFGFDEALAHLIFAAADILLVPSLFEPCGLTQMIALRYGTIPIVHRVGGLKDTIFDIDHSSVAEEKKNGYTFSSFSEEILTETLHRALDTFHHKQAKWQQLIANGMSQDWSWNQSAAAYVELYHLALRAAP